MNHEENHVGTEPRPCFPTIIELGLLATLTAVMTFAAALARPVWDDAWLQLLQSAGGSICENMRDRPMLGSIWAFLERYKVLWSSAYLVHWAGWFSMGVVTMALWIRLFPQFRRFGLLVGCLAVASIICETQLVLITTMIGYLPGIILVYLAFLLFPSPDSTEALTKWRKPLGIVALALIVPACLVSEYPVPAALACSVLAWFFLKTKKGTTARTRIVLAGGFLLCAVVGYALLWFMADASARSDVRPEETLLRGGVAHRATEVVVGLINTLWRLSLGRLLDKARYMTIDPSYAGLIVLLASVLSAVVVTWVSRKDRGEFPRREDEEQASWREGWPLLLALAAGLLPVVFMRPTVASGVGTRFWLPVLPVASCLMMFVLFKLIKQRLAWTLIPFLGFLVAYSTMVDVRRELSNCRRTHAWGTEIRKYLSEKGLTVAVFMPDSSPIARTDYELTARLTRDWPREDRNRFWAYQSLAAC